MDFSVRKNWRVKVILIESPHGGFHGHGGTPSHHPCFHGIFHEINHPVYPSDVFFSAGGLRTHDFPVIPMFGWDFQDHRVPESQIHGKTRVATSTATRQRRLWGNRHHRSQQNVFFLVADATGTSWWIIQTRSRLDILEWETNVEKRVLIVSIPRKLHKIPYMCR